MKHCIMGQIFRDIKVLHNNVNGIYSSRTELEHLITEHKPDVITINETHLNNTQKLTFPNYTIFRKDRHGRKGGGVAILCKSNLPVTEITIPNEHKHIETVLIQIHIRTWPLYICTLYNPPKSQLLLHFLNYLTQYSKLIVLRDLNAHNPLLGDNFNTRNKQGRDLIEHLKQSSLHQVLLPGPTRIPQTSAQSFTTPVKILATTQ